MKNAQETTAQPVPWYVVITVTDMETGEAVPVSRFDCRDLLHARTLLSEIRELAESLEEFLPGLVATGYELGDGVPALLSFAEVMEASDMKEEDKLYWRGEIAREGLLGAA